MLNSLFDGHYPKAILFDLDGTLIDSLSDLALAIDDMLVELNLPPAGVEKTRLWLGNGAKKLTQRALADAKGVPESALCDDELTTALKITLEKYAVRCGQSSTLYPGVAETLHALKQMGVILCIITNKPKQFTPIILKKHGMFELFDLILSGDSLDEKKPSPLPILYTLRKLNLCNDQVVMVGDSRSDITAANSAGIKSVCVTYGYNHGQDPRELPANAHIGTFSELTSL